MDLSAAVISVFLTITASGLYSQVTVLSSRAVQMQQISGMSFSHIDLSEGDSLTGETTELIMFFDLSNPLWTYGILISSSLNALTPDPFLDRNTTFEGVSVSMKLLALRPSLQCTDNLCRSSLGKQIRPSWSTLRVSLMLATLSRPSMPTWKFQMAR